ncbi:MAG TPA: prepilin-type N-terminal cleavage/methylation domain-containing protein [Opitutaceae bacterium]|nr:prepilin-type N-terminal cleavage/methylation domain-containing protein [Opitutaceae bacterium]
MTTITLSPARKSGRRRGFTLVEVLIGATLSSFILAGVLSTFLFLGRSGANMQSYSDMESEARRGLELFAQDVRQASAITWNSETSITLTVNATAITYSYDSAQRVFFRNGFRLINGVTAGTFSFRAFNVAGVEMPVANAGQRTIANASTKQLQLSLQASRFNTTVVAATNTVLSARFILRNKHVTA